MQIAAIALGSNLTSGFGDRAATLREAVRRIGALGRVTAVSSFFDTEPVGFAEQPRFLNGALLLETALAPAELMKALLAIEREMGRDRTSAIPKGPRIIDLDLLLMGDVVVDAVGHDGQPALTLPHPEMAGRRFVLEPLAEVASEMRNPRTGESVAEMLAALK